MLDTTQRRLLKITALCTLLALLAAVALGALGTYHFGSAPALLAAMHRAIARAAAWRPLALTPLGLRMFVLVVVPGILFAGLAAAILLVGRARRRRRPAAIAWPSNGHATPAIQNELTFQQLLMQLQARLTQMEDKIDSLETMMMKRALQSE